ncbi:MAG: VTT domain-containing protein [Nanoarchaeota archaeon]
MPITNIFKQATSNFKLTISRKNKIKAAIGIIFIIIVFLTISYLIQRYLENVKKLISFGIISMVIYVFILIFATVVAPVNAFPLLPVASNVWGWFITGTLSIIGWTIGAVIAFTLARKYGVPLITKFISLEDIAKYERLIPEENIFWSIVFLRMSVPVDILSYILGLFSHIKLRTYLFASIIGIAPLAFVFAYIGGLPFKYQIIAFLIAVFMLLIGYGINKGYRKYKLLKMLKEQKKAMDKAIQNVLPTLPEMK